MQGLQRAAGRQELSRCGADLHRKSAARPPTGKEKPQAYQRVRALLLLLLPNPFKFHGVGEHRAVGGIAQSNIARVPERPQQGPVPCPMAKIHDGRSRIVIGADGKSGVGCQLAHRRMSVKNIDLVVANQRFVGLPDCRS